MFLHLSVSHSVHRWAGVCLWVQADTSPLWADTPQADTLLGRHPSPRQTCPPTPENENQGGFFMHDEIIPRRIKVLRSIQKPSPLNFELVTE